ncbi:lipopolysaccharide biosynthesis protein [Emticicia oligotrophica DSM 17448]|uniref:Lipopolysaccharide biosynthesis protein n=1 Tax=Emticicia oligotrophica (strain DSM 17448 / CIP 109782 / MTCC 6937 / GPTSA100-15) TaxID=929562 RepID=A0ABN4AKW8_EMTOG|nr:Wzz/FepE/Etk N-terminal domain-containing protein [Emticicia oligotrophica]AFK02922.1 lipopolysaccharide biosynthesis protein [Emticicia oligotrophica DSM 17448]
MEEEKDDLININFGALLSVFKKEILIIILATLIFTSGGVTYALLAREEFEASGKILPEMQSKTGNLGQLAGLASLAGFDIGGASGSGIDAVRPDLYPDVLKSTPFFLSLFKVKVKTKDNQEIPFAQFYDTFVLKNKIKQENTKIQYPQSNEYITLSYQTEKNIVDLRRRINAVYDKKTGLITVNAKFPDPVVATLVTNYSMNYLTQYITNYRTEKAKRDLNFLAERLDAAKGKYYNNQAKKAQYSDQYQLSMMKLQTADLQRERIESEYRISSTFYNTLLQKYEEAKLKLQQETPVIKVLEPPVVPNKKTEPKRVIIVLISAILGIVFGMIVSLVRKKNYKLFIS